MKIMNKLLLVGLLLAGSLAPASANTTFTSIYSPIKSIQSGVISVSSTATATITSVNTAKAFVLYGGNNAAVNNGQQISNVVLTNATTVTATGGDGIHAISVSWTVVEFN